MKKKILLIILLILSILLLCGCSGDSSGQYPYIRVINTIWKLDNFNIPIGNNYALDLKKPYEVTFSDDGAIVNIYFVKKGIE